MKPNQINRVTAPAPSLAEPLRKKPVHEVRLGLVKAAIWENMVGEMVRYNVTCSRIYKDENEWKTTDAFGRDDLLVLAKVADQAHTWICSAAKSDR